ncbi:substrate-binding domain-containing protein [Paenibacillus sp. FA6]|uniref:substrate-binding domain-containing protein n=1 Tax=Paenibacillus sp. FA6 TaxID=3413029 RepID=UPI003F65CA26
MKAKYILLMFICILVLLSFRDTTPTKKADDQVKYLIGVSQPNLSDPWQVVMNDEISQEVKDHTDMKVIFTDAATSSQQQISDVKKLIGYGVDLLIISLDDPIALTSTVSEVYGKIPVIVLGRGVTDYDYTLYIGTDNEMIGQKAGQFALESLGLKGGHIVEIQGLRGSPSVIERSLGFREAIASQPNIQIIQSINADWQRDKAEDLLVDFLKDNRKIDMIFAHNEAMALGAIRALKSTNLPAVDIIGIDGVNSTNSSLKLVSENNVTGMFTSPTGGTEAIQYAIDILNKEKGIPKKIILRSQRITLNKQGIQEKPKESNRKEVALNRKIKLGFAQVGSESGWRIANTKSVLSAAADAGIELIYENAEQSQEKQIEIIRRFIEMKVDVIAFSPKTEIGWEEVLQEARHAGIPVILSDREVKVIDDTLWTTYMGSDFMEEGRRAARWLVNETKDQNRTYNIVEIQGTETSAPAIGRKKGFEQVIRDNNDYMMLESFIGDFTFQNGKDLMAEALNKYGGNIHVVYSHNDDMALGAIEAIEDYGLKPGKDIIMISVDATAQAFKAMSTGKLNCAVECNPLLGPQIMKAVKDLMEGKEPPMKILTSEGVFTQEMAKIEMSSREY